MKAHVVIVDNRTGRSDALVAAVPAGRTWSRFGHWRQALPTLDNASKRNPQLVLLHRGDIGPNELLSLEFPAYIKILVYSGAYQDLARASRVWAANVRMAHRSIDTNFQLPSASEWTSLVGWAEGTHPPPMFVRSIEHLTRLRIKLRRYLAAGLPDVAGRMADEHDAQVLRALNFILKESEDAEADVISKGPAYSTEWVERVQREWQVVSEDLSLERQTLGPLVSYWSGIGDEPSLQQVFAMLLALDHALPHPAA